MIFDAFYVLNTIDIIAGLFMLAVTYLSLGVFASIYLNEQWRWYAHTASDRTINAWGLYLFWPIPLLWHALFKHYLHRPDEAEWKTPADIQPTHPPKWR